MDNLIRYETRRFYHSLPGWHTFRLIIIEPGDIHSPVIIRLQVTDFDTAPAYDAISYVWGDPGHKITISCDGQPFEVTLNLFWSLVRIRSKSQPRILWADAICINQTDLTERSHQVTLMGKLYASARLVYICMGDAENAIAYQAQTVIKDAMAIGQLASQVWHPLKDDHRWYAVSELTKNAWFQRAWVVQEAALAKKPIVLWGKLELGYRDLLRVLQQLSDATWSIRYGFTIFAIHLDWSDWHGAAHSQAYTFVDLLSCASSLNCTDPRDKVYAFLGHFSAYNSLGYSLVKPDYHKAPGQVFLELSIALIHQQGLRVLTTVEHTSNTICDALPSWVTRWDVQGVLNDILRADTTIYRAAAGLTPTQFQIAEDRLVFQGILFDKVQHSFTIHVGDNDISLQNTPSGEVLSLESIFTMLNTGAASVTPYSDRMGAILATLSVGKKQDEAGLKRMADCFITIRRSRGQPGARTYSQEEQDVALTFYQHIRVYGIGRRFVITEKGYYGLVPLLTCPGDIVCVVSSIDVPLILRCHDTQTYRLLGESYVHGIMEGQVKEKLELKELAEQSIVIY